MSGSLDLTFIGSGNAFAPGGLCWNGFLANGNVLFEAPPSALMGLNKVGCDPNLIDTVVISHHHGDHFLGLPFLFLHWKYRKRDRPVTVVGPPTTRDAAIEIARLVYPGAFDVDYGIRWIELKGGDTATVPGVDLEAVTVCHDDRLELCLGYKAKIAGVKLGYTGDSSLCDGVLDLARGSEVLVSECASYEDDIPIHMNLVDDVPRLRAVMADSAPLILTHLTPEVRPTGLGKTWAAEDFQTYTTP